MPFRLSSLSLTLSGAKSTPSAEGLTVVSTGPLGGAPWAPAATAENRSSRNPRVFIAVALMLAVGSTVLVWPSSEEPVEAADPVPLLPDR